MKIRNITISNILSFPKIELLNAPPTIIFNDDFTILIGPNGAGKSNLIEIVNYILNI
jgi:DNA repair exonuclease SbcCD ATPase subunit